MRHGGYKVRRDRVRVSKERVREGERSGITRAATGAVPCRMWAIGYGGKEQSGGLSVLLFPRHGNDSTTL
jgi:hypothetical protein